MTIDQAYQFCLYVANKEQRGSFTPDQFNIVAPIMQMSVVNDRLGNLKKYRPHDPIPNYGPQVSQKSGEELRHIYKITNPSILNGKIGYPTDSIYLMSITSNGKTIDICSGLDEFNILNNSVIKPPTTSAPICAISGSSIFILPANTSGIELQYIRRPLTPIWAYTGTTTPVYDPVNSTDFELLDTTHLEICAKILQAVGVNLDSNTLLAYAKNEEVQGS